MFKKRQDLIATFIKYGAILFVTGFLLGLVMVAFNS